MMFDLKGHIRSNKALYVYIFSSNNLSVNPLLSLYASISFLSLSIFFSLSLFQPPALLSTPLHWHNNHPTAAADKKISRGNSCSLSLPSPSLTLSLCLSIFSLSLILILSFSFPSWLSPPLSFSYSLSLCLSIFPLYLFSLSRSSSLFLFFHPSHQTSASYPPYPSLSFLSPSFFLLSFF